MIAVAQTEPLPIAAARAGDPAAWDSLFKRFQLPLYVYIYEQIRDEQASLDLVQESFLNATRHLNSLEHDEKFPGWLFRIAHQKVLQHWRRPPPPEVEVPEELEDPLEAPGELLVRRERTEQFLNALDALPLEQRSALLLHFLEEFPLHEIARIEGVPLGTVKSRLHYAKRALRNLLDPSL